jgi:hypothetical protein
MPGVPCPPSYGLGTTGTRPDGTTLATGGFGTYLWDAG